MLRICQPHVQKHNAKSKDRACIPYKGAYLSMPCMTSFLSPKTVGASSFSITPRSIHTYACKVTEHIVQRPMLMVTCLAKSHVSKDVTRPSSCCLAKSHVSKDVTRRSRSTFTASSHTLTRTRHIYFATHCHSIQAPWKGK
jgi:hypothetical protein